MSTPVTRAQQPVGGASACTASVTELMLCVQSNEDRLHTNRIRRRRLWRNRDKNASMNIWEVLRTMVEGLPRPAYLEPAPRRRTGRGVVAVGQAVYFVFTHGVRTSGVASCNIMEYAMGCLPGGMVGDAAGAVLEFSSGGPLKLEAVERAMRMPGGGGADDSELDLALLAALVSSSFSEFPIQAVAANYIAWHRSNPFDIGMTCGRALAFAKNAADAQANAARYSMLSEANGTLMRCAPIAVWAALGGRRSVGFSKSMMHAVALVVCQTDRRKHAIPLALRAP